MHSSKHRGIIILYIIIVIIEICIILTILQDIILIGNEETEPLKTFSDLANDIKLVRGRNQNPNLGCQPSELTLNQPPSAIPCGDS